MTMEKNKTWFMSEVLVLVTTFIIVPLAHADPDSGLVWAFNAKAGVADGATDMSDFRDALTVSAASTPTLTFQYDNGHEPFFTNLTVKSGIANATYDGQTCLFLDQPTNYVDGSLHSYEQRATIPRANLANSTEGASFFARVKWLGRSRPRVGEQYPYNYNVALIDNGNNWGANGWGFYLGAYGGDPNNAWLSVVVGGSLATASSGNLVSDESQWTAGKILGNSCDVYSSYDWVDVAVTLRSVPGEGRTYVTFFKCDSASHAVKVGRTFVNRVIAEPLGDGSLFGGTTGGQHVDGKYDGNFRGAVNDVRLWNRCLGEEEMLAVFAGQQQGWSVGVANGSADEFSDTECVTPFNPRTMQWSGMRKTLTAANPSVSLTATFPSDRRSLPRVLHLKPILSAEAAGAKLGVGLNGTEIGEVSLRNNDCWLYVKEKTFRELVGNDGIATFTLTRTGNKAGTVSFDFLELTGSFQLGEINRSDSEFTWDNNGLRNIYSSVENTSIYHATLPQNNSLTINFPLRQSVADKYKFRFSIGLFGRAADTLPLSFSLNGSAISPERETYTTSGNTWKFSFEIEPGFLQEDNKIVISSGAATESPGTAYRIDYYRMDVVNTVDPGFVIVVR